MATGTTTPGQPAVGDNAVKDNQAGQPSDHVISLVARFLFDARRERRLHFDEFSGTNGAFAILLGLFVERKNVEGVSAAQTIDFSEAPLSTAMYVLGVLVEGGWVRQIGVAGQERYALSVSAERAMQCYLAANVDALRDACRPFA